MARTINRSPEQRLRVSRRVCIGGAVFEFAACIALLFLLRWPTNVIVVGIAAVTITPYEIVLWRTINKQAVDQDQSSTRDVF